MSKLEEYADHAEECQHKADSAKDDNEKAAWLRLTQSWLWMTQTEVDLKTENRGEDPPDSDHKSRKSAH
jgi:hypothetical protein